MSQMITWEESWGSPNLTSRRSPSDLEQVPCVVLVFNGPREDIAPYLCERSSPELSDFDGLPPEPDAGMGMQGGGPCEVRRGICVQPIVPRLSSGVPKTLRLLMCITQNNTTQFPQSDWDKGNVLQSPPICWCCLPDVLIPPDKLGNTFIPNRHVAQDNKVGLSALGVNRCCQVIAAEVKKATSS